MTDSLQETLLLQLHTCFNLFRRNHHQGHGGGRGAHHGQGRILAILAKMSPLTQRELATFLHIQPPSLSAALDKLEADGLIARSKNGDDKRVTDVSITKEGEEQVAEIRAARESRVDSLFSSLSQEEQESLSLLLGKLIAALESTARNSDEDEGDEGENEGCGCGRHGGGHHGKGGGHRHGKGPHGRHRGDSGRHFHHGQRD